MVLDVRSGPRWAGWRDWYSSFWCGWLRWTGGVCGTATRPAFPGSSGTVDTLPARRSHGIASPTVSPHADLESEKRMMTGDTFT